MCKAIFITGVSGAGKSTIGRLLSEAINIPFFDGDDYHSMDNKNKMSQGIPLNDQDRRGWLETINALAKQEIKKKGCVIACSALKQNYRNLLTLEITNNTIFVFLEGSFELIQDRMKQRTGHFMPISLLKSQFEILEIPKNVFTISIKKPPNEIVQQIKRHLQNQVAG
ncbi:gluconokinase, GntK/IdnK-type [Ascidiimonas sp. W6]|uniref:gluconokinase n=1 Tax=Ascidiimonas meishanensis TaxID=3128903 RepID=UPI0030EDF496